MKNKIIASLFLVGFNVFILGMDGRNSVGSELDEFKTPINGSDSVFTVAYNDIRQNKNTFVAPCPKAMGCQLAKEMRLRYIRDFVSDKNPIERRWHVVNNRISVAHLWFLVNVAKDEVENLVIRREIKDLAAQIPFPCKDESGEMIPMQRHPKSKNLYVPFFKAPEYQKATKVIEDFNSAQGLLKAETIVRDGKSLNLVKSYNKNSIKPKIVPWLCSPVDQKNKK